jgi:hypothetical protein
LTVYAACAALALVSDSAGNGIARRPLDQELVEQDASPLQLAREHVGVDLQGDSGGAELILRRLVADEF